MQDAVNTLKSLKKLARGVLRQALDDLRYDPSADEIKELVQTTRSEARAWFLDDTRSWGSFYHVCALLQRDPAKMRARLDLTCD